MRTLLRQNASKCVVVSTFLVGFYILYVYRKSPVEFKTASKIAVYKISDSLIIFCPVRNVRRNSLLASPYLTEISTKTYAVGYNHCNIINNCCINIKISHQNINYITTCLDSLKYTSVLISDQILIASMLSKSEVLYSGMFPMSLSVYIKTSDLTIKMQSLDYHEQYIYISQKNSEYKCDSAFTIGSLK